MIKQECIPDMILLLMKDESRNNSVPIFSRRFSREKCPTLTVASFFRQTTDLIAYVPLFTDFTLAHMYSSVLGLR